MRHLGLAALLLAAGTASGDAFGPPTQLTQENVPRAEVASTAAGPLAVWLEDGGAVKANGHAVTPAAERAAVASIDDFALVVWTQADGRVMAMRRRADGTAAGIGRRVGSHATGAVAIAAANGRYFVAWAGSLGEVYAAIVSPLGLPLVPAMAVTTQSGSTIGEISAAAAADGFAAVWHELPARKVYAITLDAGGVPLSMTPLLVSDDGAFPDVASDGTGFFTVWGAGTIHARTLAVDRALGRVRTVAQGVAPRVAWDGSAYALAFAREVRPRPGFSFHQLATMRISVYGTFVERLEPANTLVPRAYDVDARAGRLDLVYSVGGVAVQSATVRPPRPRTRAVRH